MKLRVNKYWIKIFRLNNETIKDVKNKNIKINILSCQFLPSSVSFDEIVY